MACLWRARRRLGRGPLAGVLFFALTLSPTLGFASFRYMQFSFVADRYQYLALVGLAAVLVGGFVQLGQRLANETRSKPAQGVAKGISRRAKVSPRALHCIGWTLAALLLCAYGALSFQRARLFQDQVTLFRHVLATNPGAKEAGHILGTFLMEREQWQEAARVYYAALERDPAEIKIHVNLASVLMHQERLEEAARVLRQAVSHEAAHLQSRRDQATARHEAAAVRVNLGLALLKLQRLDEAEQTLRRAMEIQPDSPEARQNLAATLNHKAVAHFAAQRYPQALTLFRESSNLNPADAQTHANLGAVLGQMGRYREAVQSFEQALAINPQLETVRAYLEQARGQLDSGGKR